MLLNGKSAVIYGAHNPIGASVAKAFAKAGATVYLAGRSPSRLQPVANDIRGAGGAAEVAEVDPLDMHSVSEHLHEVGVQHGTVDVSLNLAFLGIEGATRLCNLSDEQFDAATFTRVRSNFVTTAAAVKVMAYQGRGIVLAAAVPEKAAPVGTMAGQAIGSAAIGALCQQLRLDVGNFGVRIAYIPDVTVTEDDFVEEIFRVLASLPMASPSPREVLPQTEAPSGSAQAEVPAGVATG
ncbi:MAG TPA: SDR family NAD(P)-dependent oxidoreductase [Thermoplasmata archaeon]|jgi:3-oxoacyl-[acyl-carrier protein] reductase|nr:SDR family NAD(P)-dependent oxidoreductase [Thermoplasmata archaeon]